MPSAVYYENGIIRFVIGSICHADAASLQSPLQLLIKGAWAAMSFGQGRRNDGDTFVAQWSSPKLTNRTLAFTDHTTFPAARQDYLTWTEASASGELSFLVTAPVTITTGKSQLEYTDNSHNRIPNRPARQKALNCTKIGCVIVNIPHSQRITLSATFSGKVSDPGSFQQPVNEVKIRPTFPISTLAGRAVLSNRTT